MYMHVTCRPISCAILTFRFTTTRNKYALIQYFFMVQRKRLRSSLMGNPNPNTSISTRKYISEQAVSSTPKAVITDLIKEKGGELGARGFAPLLCDRRQVSYAHQRSCSSGCDPLYIIMLECKLTQGSAHIRSGCEICTHSHLCDVFFNWQLNDMARFLRAGGR